MDIGSAPYDHTILGCHWMYKTKFHLNGTMAQYKALLVAQGYQQQEGVDFFFEIFSPMEKITNIHVFLTLVIHHN